MREKFKNFVNELATIKLDEVMYKNVLDTHSVINPFPHTTNLQQMTLKTSAQKQGKSL